VVVVLAIDAQTGASPLGPDAGGDGGVGRGYRGEEGRGGAGGHPGGRGEVEREVRRRDRGKALR